MTLLDLPMVSTWLSPGKAPASVSHYTSAGGFLGMIQTGHLWATEATGLNDYSEITEGQRFFRAQWLEKRHVLESIAGVGFTEDLEGAFGHLAPEFAKALHRRVPYILCASSEADDANQWRLYADGGRGFSVDLDTSEDLALCPAPVAKVEPGELPGLGYLGLVQKWSPVLYEQADREAAFDHLITWLAATAKTYVPKISEDPRYALSIAVAASAAADRLCSLIKTRGFAGEHESRIVVDMDDHADDWINFRPTQTGIVSTVHLRNARRVSRPAELSNRSEIAPLPITRVRVGPQQDYDLVEPTIHALLSRYGYRDVIVERSQASLRRS